MSVTVTISSYAKLNQVKELLGAKDENETIEFALERIIKEFDRTQSVNELPQNFFEDLYGEDTNLLVGESIKAILKEREESDF